MAAQIITPETARSAINYLRTLSSEDRLTLLLEAWDASPEAGDAEFSRDEVEEAALDIALALGRG